MSATYTVKEVAELLGYSTNSIYTFLKEKRIRGVRIGKGRFRIPQVEVDRLLLVKRGAKSPITVVSPLDISLNNASETPIIFHEPVAGGGVSVPSLFDWFIGISGVTHGLALFLFNRYFAESAFDAHSVWSLPVRVSLIGAGLGLLYASTRHKTDYFWHHVFLATIAITYAIYAIFLFTIRDGTGVALYATIALVIAMHILMGFRSVLSMTLFVGILNIALPLAYIISPSWVFVSRLLPESIAPWSVAGALSVAGVVVVSVLFIWSYRKSRVLFWILLSLLSMVYLAGAYGYASETYWSRAFFMLLIALTVLFIPTWESYRFESRRDRMGIFVVFGSVLALFVLSIFVIWSAQRTLLDITTREIQNKAEFGRILVEATMENSQRAVESLATNPQFVSAVENGDDQAMLGIVRGVYEGSSRLRRVGFITKDGIMKSAYPYDVSFEGADLSGRPYLKQVQETGKTVITDIFMGVTNRQVVLFATPVYGGGEYLGVAYGALDNEALGDRLQQLADSTLNEFFSVIDRAGNFVIAKDLKLVGLPIDERSNVRKALLGYRDIEQGSVNGIQMMEAYEPIAVSSWGLAIHIPMTSVYRSTTTALIVIVVVSLTAVVIVIGFLVLKRPRMIVPIDSS